MLAYAGTLWHAVPTTSTLYTRRSIQSLHEAMLAFEYNDFVTIIQSMLPSELAILCIEQIPKVPGLPKIIDLATIWIPRPFLQSQIAVPGPITPQYFVVRPWDSKLVVL